MEYDRPKRVGHLIREEISDIIMKRLKDPRVGFVTVTQVEISKDLRRAKVYVSVMGSREEVDLSLEGLNSAKYFIKRELGKRVRLKFLPDLDFVYDESMEHAFRIDSILRELRRKGELGGEEDRGGDI